MGVSHFDLIFFYRIVGDQSCVAFQQLNSSILIKLYYVLTNIDKTFIALISKVAVISLNYWPMCQYV